MKQKILTLFFAVFMMMGVFSLNSDAAAQSDTIEVVDWGYCGNSNVEWGITSDGILILAGDGNMPDYPTSNTPWSKYKSYIYAIVVDGSVKYIGENAFHYCENLEIAIIGEGVTQIGKYVFADCENMKTIEIPNSVTSIGECAFLRCFSLQSIQLPSKLKILEPGIFIGCTNLKEVDFQNNFSEIPMDMFRGCHKLTKIKLPDGLKSINQHAFFNCDNLTTIRIPSSVTVIKQNAFLSCDKLHAVTIVNPKVRFEPPVFSGDPELLIRCIENSTAHTYAKDNRHAYELIDISRVTEYFADVPENKWYTGSVQYVFDEELMSGSGDYFNPTKNVTRAQLVTTLYRLAGSPEVTDYSACKDFSDVAEGKYYTDAVCWAYNEGITTGNNGKFDTTGNLTRQQMAAFFFRFAEVMGYDTTISTDFSHMLNADKVSDYAVSAMEWAVGAGLISGSETKDEAGNVVYDLNPRGNTTRAQLSAILQRFCEGVANTEKPDTDDELPGVPLV